MPMSIERGFGPVNTLEDEVCWNIAIRRSYGNYHNSGGYYLYYNQLGQEWAVQFDERTPVYVKQAVVTTKGLIDQIPSKANDKDRYNAAVINTLKQTYYREPAQKEMFRHIIDNFTQVAVPEEIACKDNYTTSIYPDLRIGYNVR